MPSADAHTGAALLAAAAPLMSRLQSRKSSQVDGAPVVTRFSIADVLGTQAQGSAVRLESPKVSIVAVGTMEAHERSGGEASVSGRSAAGLEAAGLRVCQRSPSRMLLRDGSASVPLEVGSPMRPGMRPAAETQRPPPGAASRVSSPGAAVPADEHHAQGYGMRKKGDFAGAVAEYTKALELDPTHFKALFNRAFSYDKASCMRASYNDGHGLLQALLA